MFSLSSCCALFTFSLVLFVRLWLQLLVLLHWLIHKYKLNRKWFDEFHRCIKRHTTYYSVRMHVLRPLMSKVSKICCQTSAGAASHQYSFYTISVFFCGLMAPTFPLTFHFIHVIHVLHRSDCTVHL